MPTLPQSVTLSGVGTVVGPVGVAVAGFWFVPFLIAAIAYFHSTSVDPERFPVNQKNLYREYDFIVVGGGSAGAVVANRLSEDKRFTVLLLEAGGDETEISDVPALANFLQLGSMDWKYKSQPQPGRACLGGVDGQCFLPRGKVIGGSSVLNYMLYVRGNRRDYDGWEAMGNPGWGYDQALYYFKKSEDNRNPYLGRTAYHGVGGYQTVQESPYRTPLVTAFLEAGVEMGYENRDGNGEFQTGFMIAQGTIRRGSRCSTAKAFLRPIRHRKNLHVALYSHVTKILIDPHTKTAYGVRFQRIDKYWQIKARKEVILSAGAINTPQLLMLSGVGPRWHLNDLGIPVIQDLPVGENFQDHYGTAALAFLIDYPISMVQTRFENIPSVLKYAVFGTGPLTSLGAIEGLAWIPTKYANKSIDLPDIELHFASGAIASDGGRQVRKTSGLTDRTWQMYRPIAFKDQFSAVPMILRPKGRGYVRLDTRNPFDHPLIQPNYFIHPDDLAVVVEGVKFVLAMTQTKAFQRFGSKFWDGIPMPGCEHTVLWSDEYWGCLCRHFTSTIYHYSGTAKMGPPTDPEAVVNHELKVYGIRGLRVIDASIMPTVPSGNTNAPTIMIGEKGSDLIKQYWYSKKRRRRRRRRRSTRDGKRRTVEVEEEYFDHDLSDWPEMKVEAFDGRERMAQYAKWEEERLAKEAEVKKKSRTKK